MEQIKLENVVNTYSGKQGCACGCGGSYKTEGPAAKLRVNRINAVLATYPHLVEVDKFATETCYSLESDSGRVTRVYVKEA